MFAPSSMPALTARSVVLVTGGHGMLGRALQAELAAAGFDRVLAPGRQDMDCLDAAAVRAYFGRHRPEVVFHLASVVFGLLGNMRNQVRAIAESTLINHNVIMTSAEAGVRKLCFAGSVACYPFPYRALPLREGALWDGVPHPGELGYAHAKRHGLAYLELLQAEGRLDYLFALLTNLYGPEDRYDEESGHVVPSLIRKMYRALHDGEPFSVWGDGTARRDFMHARDAAAALIAATQALSGPANIASGTTATIREVVDALVAAAGYRGEVAWQPDKPAGVPDRSVDVTALRSVPFRCRYGLRDGIKDAWTWFQDNHGTARR